MNKILKKIIICLLLIMSFCMLLVAVGCSCNEEAENNFDLRTKSLKIAVGGQAQIAVLNAELSDVTFQSNDVKIATVDENGIVLGISKGKTEISATCLEITKTVSVEVVDLGIMPHISINNLPTNKTLNLVKGSIFTLDSQVIFNGDELTVPVTFESLSASVASVNNNVITANEIGSSMIIAKSSYLSWEFYEIITVNVIPDVQIVFPMHSIVLNDAGNNTQYTIGQCVVYKNGEVINTSVTLKIEDETVATLNEQTVIAQSVGATKLLATCEVDGKTYDSYIEIVVQAPQLASPENLRINEADGKFEWDAVAGADSYVVTIDGVEQTTSATFVEVGEYFGDTLLGVYAVDTTGEQGNSERVDYNYQFKSKLFTDYLTDNLSTSVYDANIITIGEYDGSTVYYAQCQSTTYSTNSKTGADYGYGFAKIYYYPQFGHTEKYGNWWCTSSLVGSRESVARYNNTIVSMWVYSITATEITYARYNDGATSLASVEVPANEWTKVSFSLSRSDLTYVMALCSKTDFFFTDLRISTADYTTKSYANSSFNLVGFANGYISSYLADVNIADLKGEDYSNIYAASIFYNILTPEQQQQLPEYDNYVAITQAFDEKYEVIMLNDMTDGMDDGENFYGNTFSKTTATHNIYEKYTELSWKSGGKNNSGLTLTSIQQLKGYNVYVPVRVSCANNDNDITISFMTDGANSKAWDDAINVNVAADEQFHVIEVNSSWVTNVASEIGIQSKKYIESTSNLNELVIEFAPIYAVKDRSVEDFDYNDSSSYDDDIYD